MLAETELKQGKKPNASGQTKNKTGVIRIVRPILINDKCTKCGLCGVLCPDNVITTAKSGYPIVNYEACTGCLICLRECPWTAIADVQEKR